MAQYFFDTSGLMKRHVAELGSSWVRSLLRPGSGHIIYIARITTVEMVAAITRRQRGGSLSAAQGRGILGHFRRHCIHRYRVIDISSNDWTVASNLSRIHGLRAYDAVQLAIAEAVAREIQVAGLPPMILVSADRELNAAATAEGLVVDDPALH